MKPASLNIEAYCIFLRHYISLLANNYKSVRILFDLRQQKLYQLISQQEGKLEHREDLRQQKLYQLISLHFCHCQQVHNLRQQKLYQLISLFRLRTRNAMNLRQQKLYQLISQPPTSLEYFRIYDSRNYISLLATLSIYIFCLDDLRQQKLYQLISHYCLCVCFILSTIVEIILAYQPLLKVLSSICIYDSRNYISLLALPSLLPLISQSTIVEIILAYQPRE